jgi:hypothetical protein
MREDVKEELFVSPLRGAVDLAICFQPDLSSGEVLGSLGGGRCRRRPALLRNAATTRILNPRIPNPPRAVIESRKGNSRRTDKCT